MSIEEARLAMNALLWELPAEFSYGPPSDTTRQSFIVIKENNVRRVHQALWELQKYLEMTDE